MQHKTYQGLRFFGGITLLLILSIVICTNMSQGSTTKHLQPLPINDLLQIGSVLGGQNAPQWSPDGKKIIFASSLNSGGLVSISPEGGCPIRLPIDLGGTGHFLASHDPRWSPDGRWISYTSNKSGAPELWLWSVSDGRRIQLTNLGGRISSLNWSPDSHWIAFSGDRYGYYDIWKVSVPDGEVFRLTREKRYEVYPFWTPDGKQILYNRLDERWVDHEVMVMTSEGENSRLVVAEKDFFDYGAGRTFGYPMVSPDGETVLFRSHRSGWINYWVVPLRGGQPRPVAAENADQSEACWSPDGKMIAYISNHDGTLDLRVVSSSGGEPRVLVAPEMGICSKPQWSPDGRFISCTFASPTKPADLFLVSVQDGKTRQLTNSMLAGNLERALVMPKKVIYPSADNLTISAYLYKPKDMKKGERYPGVMWIHGGPTSQFLDTFQQSVQFFVQRGYVLLLPNIRGSSGYGKEFEKMNNKCWGECDLKDVIAGVEYLKTLSYVDPNNMGITGTSYGGDFTMAAVGRAPGVFQAAIACSGEADWVRSYHENEMRHVKLWDYELGPINENLELYERLSPIAHIENVTTPTFVIHGEGLFPESELAKLFATELQRHYKVFRYKAYQGETFYVRSQKNRRQMLIDMLEFFNQFLKDNNVHKINYPKPVYFGHENCLK